MMRMAILSPARPLEGRHRGEEHIIQPSRSGVMYPIVDDDDDAHK